MSWITFDYHDLNSMTAWTFNIWDLFFQGKLSDFYEYTALNIHGAGHPNCNGNYLALLPWCLWNLPLWLVHSLCGITLVTNFWSICYSKLFLIVMEIVTACVSGKICMMLTDDKMKAAWTYLLVLAAPEIMMSVEYAGQDEIVYLGFFMLALYCYLKNYKKRAYALMVFSVVLCPIMLIPLLAILLLEEKNIFKLILKAGVCFIPSLVFDFLYRNDALYNTELKYNNDLAVNGFNMLKEISIGTGTGYLLSISGVLLVFLYFYCYSLDLNNNKEDSRKVIYILTLIFCIINFTMANYFYRLMHYVPFLVILIFISEQELNMNLLLLSILTYGRTFLAGKTNGYVNANLSTNYIIRNSWITKLCDTLGVSRYNESKSFYLYLSYRRYTTTLEVIVYSSVIAAILILLVINRPGYIKKYNTTFIHEYSKILYCACTPCILMLFYIVLLH